MKSIKDFQKENMEQVPLNGILGGAAAYVETIATLSDNSKISDVWDDTTFDECDIYYPSC
jgi:hypothetical protein